MTGGGATSKTTAPLGNPPSRHIPPRSLEAATCYACGAVKPLEDFARDKLKASGHKSICKMCDRAKARRYYQRNREAVLARIAARKVRP